MRSSSWCVPRAVTTPSWRKSTRSARSSSSGLAVITDGGAPGPWRSAQPLGDPRLGVGVDGARGLDEHEHLGVGEQRAGQREALALAAGERPAALLDLAVQPVGRAPRGRRRRWRPTRAREDRRVVVAAPRVELVAQRPLNRRGSVSTTTTRRRTVVERAGRRGDVRPRRTPCRVLAEPAQPVGQRGGVLRAGGDEGGEQARLDDDAAARVDQRDAAAPARPRGGAPVGVRRGGRADTGGPG